jgi:predicted 3-demethylubiquinone-9 3-methyltransferase (glyoxalase superfamily)
MQKITPFLWFDGNVDEAIHFYTSVFKNSKIKNVRNFPDERPGKKGKVFTATFELEGVEFMILDGGPHYKIDGPAISFFVKCKDQAEVDELWDKIAEEGTPMQCGWITDKYGVSWQIIPDILGKVLGGPDAAGAQRAMQAMMKMVKLDVATLEAAYNNA